MLLVVVFLVRDPDLPDRLVRRDRRVLLVVLVVLLVVPEIWVQEVRGPLVVVAPPMDLEVETMALGVRVARQDRQIIKVEAEICRISLYRLPDGRIKAVVVHLLRPVVGMVGADSITKRKGRRLRCRSQNLKCLRFLITNYRQASWCL